MIIDNMNMINSGQEYQLTTPTFVTDFNFELPQAGIRGSMK